jgi:hypothetical protein
MIHNFKMKARIVILKVKNVIALKNQKSKNQNIIMSSRKQNVNVLPLHIKTARVKCILIHFLLISLEWD